MYDARTLKPTIEVDELSVECPVMGCTVRVPRQRRHFRREDAFRCLEHDIYISASTYEHREYTANILSADTDDVELLRRLLGQKRETERLGRERSEDALTFNVFRTLEREGQLDATMSALLGRQVHRCLPAYWSLNSSSGRPEKLLADARTVFREVNDRGTEPDLLIESADTLFLLEAKLGARNATTPTHTRSLKGYERAASGWYAEVFVSDPETVALRERLYQLMRLWLLGTWMAAQVQKRFVLVSLCADACDTTLASRFGLHIRSNNDRRFVRWTWEQLRDHARLVTGVPAIATLVEYLDNRTLGYDAKGVRQLAFTSERRALSAQRGGKPKRDTVTADAGLHVLRNHWTQTRKLGQHCEMLAEGFSAAVQATKKAAPLRVGYGFRMSDLPRGARKEQVEYSARSAERTLEQRLYAAHGPSGTFASSQVVRRLVAYQVPLFNSVQRQGWGHIDLLGLDAEGRPVVIELKRGASKETPLRCLMEGVANAIAVQENWREIRPELEAIVAAKGLSLAIAEQVHLVTTVVLAPTAYWAEWEPEPKGQPGFAVRQAAREAFWRVCDVADESGYPVVLAEFDLPLEVEPVFRAAETSFSRPKIPVLS